jgi:hypothetical protein
MNSYRLAPEVHLSASEEGAVVLDLRNDDYLGLDSMQAYALALVVRGWPRPQVASPQGTVSFDDACVLAESLRERGLLVTDDGSCEQAPMLPSLPVAESELIPWEHMRGYGVRTGHVLSFLTSATVAAILLGCRPFARVVARVRSRRPSHDDSGVCDGHKARQLVSAYFHIRAFVFGPKNRCLLDSLTLIEFLARYGVYPRWVIGVQVSPFGSHSWVQHEAFVLNGTPSYVRAYDPILVV